MGISAPPAEAQASSGALISEFRFRGAGGATDEYVELYNPQNAPLDINGWSIRFQTATGLQTALVPANTPPIPAQGHFLFTGAGYNAALSLYAPSDASLGADARDDSGVALFNATGALQDAVGFASSDAGLREGAGLPSAPNVAGEYAFLRDFNGQFPRDSGDNAADWVFLSTNGASVAGTNGPLAAQLGSPNPEGLASPTNFNTLISTAILDPLISQNSAPNRVRTGTGDSGDLLVRRTLTNNSSQTITKIRLFVTRITSQNSPLITASQADVRLTGSATETVAVQGQPVTVYGTSLEAPSSPTSGAAPLVGGGGLGSSLAFDLLLSTPLQPNESRSYAFRLQVARSGNFVVIFNFLALSPPMAITDLSVYLGNTQATLNWSAASGATSYKIERKVGTGAYAELAARPTATTFTDTGLSNGVLYTYRVYALNLSGSSAASNEVSVTPAPVVRGVDLKIGAGTTLVGSGMLFPDTQTYSQDCGAGVAAVFRLVIENTGNTRDTFRLSGRGDTPVWKVRYFDAPTGGTDISALIKPNNYLVTLDSRVTRELRVEVTPDASAQLNEAKDVPVSARSENEPLYNDQVTAQAVQRNVAPPPPIITRAVDASIRLASQSAYQGTGTQSPTPGAAQTVEGFASSGSAAVFNWRVKNEGSATEPLILTLPAATPGWTVNLFDALDGGTNITTSAVNGTYQPEVAPGAWVELRLEVKPDASTQGTLPLSLSAKSSADNSKIDVCAANTSALSSITDSPAVSFSGPTRAVAGGLGSALHKVELILNATQGGAALPYTTFKLSFENNTGHNYGTATAPNIPRRAKIFDPGDNVTPWKETQTVTTDGNGQVPVTLLSSDVISQPRLIARWESAGETETVGGVKFDCAAAISKRGVEDPALVTNPTNWAQYDTGWSCNLSALEKSGDTVQGSLYLKFSDSPGVFRQLAGHTVRIALRSLSTLDNYEIYDLEEASAYLRLVDVNGQELDWVDVTTDVNGIATFTLKAKNAILGISQANFKVANRTQWMK